MGGRASRTTQQFALAADGSSADPNFCRSRFSPNPSQDGHTSHDHASAAEPARLRLLCLHGYGSNNDITALQLGHLQLEQRLGVACDLIEANALEVSTYLSNCLRSVQCNLAKEDVIRPSSPMSSSRPQGWFRQLPCNATTRLSARWMRWTPFWTGTLEEAQSLPKELTTAFFHFCSHLPGGRPKPKPGALQRRALQNLVRRAMGECCDVFAQRWPARGAQGRRGRPARRFPPRQPPSAHAFHRGANGDRDNAIERECTRTHRRSPPKPPRTPASASIAASHTPWSPLLVALGAQRLPFLPSSICAGSGSL